MAVLSRYRSVLTSQEAVAAAVTALLTLVSWGAYLAGAPPTIVAVLGIAGALAGGLPIAWGAVQGLIRREMNVDELVTLAIAAALIVGEYWGAALVAIMMLVGKVLEDVTAARADAAIEGLGQLVPAVASVRDGAGTERTVAVADLRPEQVVVVRPGERLPVDGVVVGGRAAVDEAAITGESLPAEKQEGDDVFAGTLATDGALEVRATRTGQATALGRIAALVKEAEAERAPIVRAADRWAQWFTPTVLVLAALVYLIRRDVIAAVSVLVVACPCALVLATPTAIVAGIARAARRGILVRGGARLESAGRVDVVCLDKTGTLTAGRPSVQRVVTFPAVFPAADGQGGQTTLSEDALVAYAAAAEHLSEHPLARAVRAAAGRSVTHAPLAASSFRAIPGQGIVAQVPRPRPAALLGVAAAASGDGHHEHPPRALATAAAAPALDRPKGAGAAGTAEAADVVEVVVGRPELFAQRGIPLPPDGEALLGELEAVGQTPLVVAVDGRAAGVIGVADAPRDEAAAAVAALRSAGVGKILLLTGDREGPARAAAAAVGIAAEDVHARLLPEQKLEWVRRLREAGHRVAMVGDGVNDAPALAAADVAIAMGAAGTDVAMSASDVVLMTDDLRQAAAAIVLSRKTLRTIRQNLAFAAVWNVAAVTFVVGGALNPVTGALVHNLGSVAVVVNAARLVNTKLGS
jgi:Cd2+/Zn2+-exporting ATPase